MGLRLALPMRLPAVPAQLQETQVVAFLGHNREDTLEAKLGLAGNDETESK